MVRSIKRKSKESAKTCAAKKTKEAETLHSPNGFQPNNNSNDENVFRNIMKNVGVILKGKVVTIDEDLDQQALQHKIWVVLKTHEQYPQILDIFTEALEDHIVDNERFISCLMPTQRPTTNHDLSVVINQDSIIKLLLGIDKLQPKIISILLEKLAVLSADDGTLQPQFQGHDIDLPRLIISQFRWLDRIVEEKELVDKILEVIPVSELPIQREIIACIPEVVQDQKHGEIATHLKDMFLHNSHLTNAVIDAFSNLNLQGETLTKIRQSVLDILNSANLEDCPAAVRFILQSVTDSDCVQVIRDLRERLNFTEDNEREDDIFSIPSQQKKKDDRDQELLTLDVIRLAIKFQKSVAGGWLKVIESFYDQSEHKIIDFFALMVMLGISTRKKTVESLMKQKIKSDVFTAEVVARALRIYSQAFMDLYKDVLSIAECLLRSPDVNLSNYGGSLYRHAFVNFDTYYQQEIIGALIMHVGSGLSTEIESSFSVLDGLVADYPAKMAPFTVFLKSILDYLDNLTVSQIRSLFFMLSSLMVHNANEDNIFEDDINILIRKHLSNSSIHYKKIGLIGTVMLVANLAKKRHTPAETTDFSNSEMLKDLDNGVFKEVINLLEMAKNCIKKDQDASGLFYDELSDIISQGVIDQRMVHWISESFVASFQDDFLVDVETITKNKNLELLYDLDEPEEGGIAVNIFPLLLRSQESNEAGPSSSTSRSNVSHLLRMNSLFRLLATCERIQHQGSLEGIDALLGCPLVMFKMDAVENFCTLDPTGKELICSALFFSINWMREIVNAFSTQDDAETKGKILSRLETIAALCSMLEKCLGDMPNYVPPQAIFDVDELTVLKPSQAHQSEKTSKKSGKRKSTKKDIDEPSNDQSFEKDPENDKDSLTDEKMDEKGKDKSSFSWIQYRPFLRELDLFVFNALKYGTVSKNILDSDLNTKETEVLALKSSSLKFLLEDLDCKLNHSLPTTSSTRKSVFKKKASKTVGFSHLSKTSSQNIAEFVVDLLPFLCDHLEMINVNFQNIMDKSDIVIDANEKESEEYQDMSENFRLILSCMERLFSWEKMKYNKSKAVLKKAALHLATRIKPIDEEEAEFSIIMKEAFHYMEELSSTARDLPTVVLILKVLSALQKFNEDKDHRSSIASKAEKFLKTDWTTSEQISNQKHNESLHFLLDVRIEMSEKLLETLEKLAGCLVEFIEDKNRSGEYPTLHRNSFIIYYKALLEKLTINMKKEISSTSEDSGDIFSIAKCSVRIFYLMISIVKAVDTRSVLACSLKLGRVFLEAFLKHCMPVLDSKLKTNKDEVHGLLKNLQQSTRCLHHFCGHSKVTQDVIMTNYVPSLKKCLEMFVFRVKAMLATNRCHSAFWLGNLKNRDLHGNEIPSQMSVDDEEEVEQDSEQVTECDQNMVDDDEDDTHTEDKSYSQSF